MWSDPSITLDLNFLELVPWLNEQSLSEYPIEGKHLLNLLNQAAVTFNISALIGATKLLFIKNDLPSQRKEFPVVHLASLDRIFYLISQARLTSKLQNDFHRQVKTAVRRWFEDTPKEELLRVQAQLKEELNYFEKVMQLVNNAEEQKKELAIGMSRKFVGLLTRDKATEAEYTAKFKDHGLYIYRNHKELFLLNVIYEMDYLLCEQINQVTELFRPDEFIDYINKKLNAISAFRRTSLSIESTAFLLRKLFIVRNYHRMPDSVYHEFLLQIEQHTGRIFSRSNLELRAGHFSFHMKHNHFFDYLEALFDPTVPTQFEIIRLWKDALAKAIIDALPNESRDPKAEDIEETIFFMQLRNWQDFLWNKQDVNEFPLACSRVVSRLIRNPALKAHGVEVAENIVNAIEKGDGLKLFAEANILERAIIFYYIHYNKYLSFFSAVESNSKRARTTALHRFKQAIDKEDLIELLEFYLLEIELGNYSKVTTVCDYENENMVYRLIYQTFIDIFNADLLNYLTNIKSIESSKELKRIKVMAKYLILLVHASCPKFKVPFICRSCRQIESKRMCCRCEYLCLAVKLYSGQNPMNRSRDRYFYEQMLHELKKRCNQAQCLVRAQMQVSSKELLCMLNILLETLLPL